MAMAFAIAAVACEEPSGIRQGAGIPARVALASILLWRDSTVTSLARPTSVYVGADKDVYAFKRK